MLEKLFPSLHCLKTMIFGGTIATVVVGILSVFFVIDAFLISTIWTQYDKVIRNEVVISVLCCSVAIALVGVSGIYGIINNRATFLIMYTCGIVIFMLLFFGIGLFSTIYPKMLANSCGQGEGQQVNQTVSAAQQLFCKDCGCYFTNMNASIYNKTELDQLKKIVVNFSDSNTSWPINATSCQQWDGAEYPDSDAVSLMEAVFSCSGWCNSSQPNLIYLFTNVNQGKPDDFCYTKILAFFEKFGTLLQISSFLVFSILCMVFLTMLCLCLHPNAPKRKESKNLKEMLLEQVNGTILQNQSN